MPMTWLCSHLPYKLFRNYYTCEDFAEECSVKFNANNTMCRPMCIGSGGHLPQRRVTLHGSHIAWSASVKHLGNSITRNLNDSDIRAKKESSYRR